VKHVPESLSQLCVERKEKNVFAEGLAPLHRFVAVCETWQSCALKSWHLKYLTLCRSLRFTLVFR